MVNGGDEEDEEDEEDEAGLAPVAGATYAAEAAEAAAYVLGLAATASQEAHRPSKLGLQAREGRSWYAWILPNPNRSPNLIPNPNP